MCPIMISEKVNIYQLPILDIEHSTVDSEITIGDLHGNTIKLLFFLVKHGAITNLSSKDYAALVLIYKKNVEELTKQDLNDFVSILDRITYHAGGIIRLLGDDLADRGQNDYFTLKLIEKLYLNKVNVEILISNHSIEYVEAYETKFNLLPPNLNQAHTKSLYNMHSLIKSGLVSKKEVLQITYTAYKSFLKAISYTLSADGTGITIYSHAGIGLNTIAEISGVFKTPYADHTAAQLAESIDKINIVFQKHVQENSVHTLYSHKNILFAYRVASSKDLVKMPIVFLTWNRRYHNITRPVMLNGYHLDFCHGHDRTDKGMAINIHNLDNTLGYFADNLWATQEYNVLYSKKFLAPVLDTHSPSAVGQDKKEGPVLEISAPSSASVADDYDSSESEPKRIKIKNPGVSALGFFSDSNPVAEDPPNLSPKITPLLE